MSKLAIYTSSAFINATGVANIGANANVEVKRESDGGLAAIYSDEDGTALIANPAVNLADANGRFKFYAAGIARGYAVKVTSGANVYTANNQAIGNAAQLDAGLVGSQVLASDDQAVARAAIGLTNTLLDRMMRVRRHFAALNYV